MSSNRRSFLILAALVALFALRVVAQATQHWHVVPFLPPFNAFQGSALPYKILLPAQVFILAVMIWLAWQVHADKLQRRPAIGRVLAIGGWIYGSVMLIRLGIGIAAPAAPAWFKVWIPCVFHLVLAEFVLVLAAYHRHGLTESADRGTS